MAAASWCRRTCQGRPRSCPGVASVTPWQGLPTWPHARGGRRQARSAVRPGNCCVLVLRGLLPTDAGFKPALWGGTVLVGACMRVPLLTPKARGVEVPGSSRLTRLLGERRWKAPAAVTGPVTQQARLLPLVCREATYSASGASPPQLGIRGDGENEAPWGFAQPGADEHPLRAKPERGRL